VLTPTLKHILSTPDFSARLRIARQFIASKKELKTATGFTDDPMCEEDISGSHANEFVHKYPDKILVIASNSCPVLCRFCTRKRITYAKSVNEPEPSAGDLRQAVSVYEMGDNVSSFERINYEQTVSYIQNHAQIQEVIFSGGDPFMLSNSKIRELLGIFLKIPQVKKIRFHSRALTVLPERFNDELFQILKRALNKYSEKQAVVVVHVNHPAEISNAAMIIIRKFMNAKIAVMSQTVLLKNVNDNTAILRSLFEKLIHNGVQPRYLHQLDRVTGSSHFEVSIDHGIKIIEALRQTLPLCMIPPYVADGPHGKKIIF
jgi:lysine 2,3-aminomutase